MPIDNISWWLLISATSIAFIIYIWITIKYHHIAHVFLALSCISLITMMLFMRFNSTIEIIYGEENIYYQIIHISRILSLAALLCAQSFIIRDSLPTFYRFPVIFSYSPLAIIPFYYIVAHTELLREWIIAIYAGGAIIIGFLNYLLATYHNKKYMFIFVGILFIIASYIHLWISNFLWYNDIWIWCLTIAILLISLSMLHLEKKGIYSTIIIYKHFKERTSIISKPSSSH